MHKQANNLMEIKYELIYELIKVLPRLRSWEVRSVKFEVRIKQQSSYEC